ncbi:hypothetical protein [Algoriphagus zhangzhouensis]|uniref:Uncharacterized protein n=1 Tax=Algoriphagus zhangzhouensis TaxID=1073327 RepID=A0A1M7Z9Q2_9BACT|nr:hypothetical protein [Algoriphagus zhangzhouensis]TDY47326.1 hypothetical protein A8938_1779 [Algoriphagus zhangzhouensis]SHO61651.1 hypothetical protein SAMN04488108_1483 [Algoriphagus zhangzhouensis]
MGIFWDLIQQSQIHDQKSKAETLEIRVRNLERELYQTREILIKILKILEEQTGKDINGDGKIG